MPYHIGAKGSNGCSGYPVVSDKGHIAGCHETESEATAQMGALYANVADATKGENSMIQTSNKPENPSDMINPKAGMKKPEVMPKGKKKRYRAMKAIDSTTILKDMVAEGDFVIVVCEDETHVGIVQYVMTEGVFGVASSDYSIEASKENPVVLIRTLELEEDEGIWEESEYLVGVESNMVTKIEPLALEVEVVANENTTSDSEIAMAMYDSSIGKTEDVNSYYSDNEDLDKWDNIQKSCWVGYTQEGMKEKDGRMVPNCVPVKKSNEMEYEMEKAKKPNYGGMIKPRSGGSKPSNPKLYARVVQAAKDKFDVYPSAVANAWVVQEYKRRGGTYSSEKSIRLDLWNGQFDPRKFNK
jgi:hypothetical protein